MNSSFVNDWLIDFEFACDSKSKPKRKLKIEKFEKEDCVICISSVSKSLPACGHWVHDECIVKWGVAKCPLCRKEQPHLVSKCKPKKPAAQQQAENLYQMDGAAFDMLLNSTLWEHAHMLRAIR
jgi:hypothetical protein